MKIIKVNVAQAIIMMYLSGKVFLLKFVSEPVSSINFGAKDKKIPQEYYI